MKRISLLIWLALSSCTAQASLESLLRYWLATNGHSNEAVSAQTDFAGCILDGVIRDTPIAGLPAPSQAWQATNNTASESWLAGVRAESNFPLPETVVPLVDTNYTQIGTARLVVRADTMAPMATTNTASPLRPTSVQAAAFRAAVATNNAAFRKAKADINGQLQTRIENLERLLGLRE